MTAIALGDFEEHKALVASEHVKANYFFVKLVHGVKVLDADGHFAQSFDTAVWLVYDASFGSACAWMQQRELVLPDAGNEPIAHLLSEIAVTVTIPLKA